MTQSLEVNIHNRSWKLWSVIYYDGEGLSLEVAESSAAKVFKGLRERTMRNLKKLGLVSLERKEDKGQSNSNLCIHNNA